MTGEHLLANIPGSDPSFNVVYSASWSSFEESGYLLILEKNGVYYSQTGGYCVMADDNTEVWSPEMVTEKEAFDLMFEWEEDEDI